MKKLNKITKKYTINAYSCSCGTCSGCSQWGQSGGSATHTGSTK